MGLRKDIKKLLVPNKVPAATSFKVDEIVINPIDGKAYIKKTDNTVIELGSGGDSAFTTEISASFSSSIAALETGGTGVQAASVSGAIDAATGSALINASAFNTNILQFTKGDASTFNVVHTASLSQDLTASLNSSVGAVSDGNKFKAGSSIEDLLRTILVDFIAPNISSLTITSLINRMEIGDSEIVTAGVFNTSSASTGEGFTGGLSLSLNNNEGGSLNNVTFTDKTIDFDDVTITRDTTARVRFRLTGIDSQGGTDTADDNNDFFSPIFFGGSSLEVSIGSCTVNDLNTILDDITSSATPTSVGSTGLISFDSQTATFGDQTYLNTTNASNFPSTTKIQLPASTADTNNFTYIVYPNTYGRLQTILNGAQNETGSFDFIGDVNHTRYNTTSYRVYKSVGKNFGNVLLTIDD